MRAADRLPLSKPVRAIRESSCLEMMLRIEDSDFAAQMRAFVDGEAARSREITAPAHRARTTFFRKIKWALSYFLVTSMDYNVTRRINFGLE